MIDEQIFFDLLEKNDLKKFSDILKIKIYQGDNYTTGFLLDFLYQKENYMLIAIDLCKQQVLDGDPNYWKSRSTRTNNNVFNY